MPNKLTDDLNNNRRAYKVAYETCRDRFQALIDWYKEPIVPDAASK